MTTTTTTTTTAPPAGPKAIDDKAFDQLAQRVSAESFSDAKVRVVREAAATNHFRAEQVAKLLSAMTMEDDKLKALSSLAPKIVDPQNNFAIDGAFTFDSNKKKAEQILNAAKKP